MKPTPRELVERMEELEGVLERTLVALKNDLAALRADLMQLDDEISKRPTKPPPSRGPQRTVSEELALRKKDPRTDE